MHDWYLAMPIEHPLMHCQESDIYKMEQTRQFSVKS